MQHLAFHAREKRTVAKVAPQLIRREEVQQRPQWLAVRCLGHFNDLTVSKLRGDRRALRAPVFNRLFLLFVFVFLGLCGRHFVRFAGTK